MPITARPARARCGNPGASISLSRSATRSAIRSTAPLEKGILLFREQKISREQHIAFSRHFGELDRHDSLPRDRHPDDPELLLVTNIQEEGGKESAPRCRPWLQAILGFSLAPMIAWQTAMLMRRPRHGHNA